MILKLNIRLIKSIFHGTENPEDIHPYATFVLPDVSCQGQSNPLQDYAAPKDARDMGSIQNNSQEVTHQVLRSCNQPSNMGTIANFDMLILHENSTLPLSDACSKSVS